MLFSLLPSVSLKCVKFSGLETTPNYLFIFLFSYLNSTHRLRFSNEVRHANRTGNGTVPIWKILPVILISLILNFGQASHF